jgi:hypothetical protein
VITRVKISADRADDDPAAFETFAYDYFCDANGRILQKRSLDDKNDVDLIVYLKYDDENSEVTERAWGPNHGLSRTHTRKTKRDDTG